MPGSQGKQRQTRRSRRWFLQTFQSNQARTVLPLLRPPTRQQPHGPFTNCWYFLPNPPPCSGLDILPSEIPFSLPEMRYVDVRFQGAFQTLSHTGLSHNSSQNSNEKLVRKLRDVPVIPVDPPWHSAENTAIHDHHQRLLRTDRIIGRKEVSLGVKGRRFHSGSTH